MVHRNRIEEQSNPEILISSIAIVHKIGLIVFKTDI